MPEKAIWINLKASRLAGVWLLTAGLLLGSVLWLQPWSWARWLILPLLVQLSVFFYIGFGPAAPVALCLHPHQLEVLNRQGEIHRLASVPCWVSFLWIAWRLPWAPYACWLLWPDAVTPAERAALRRWIYAQRAVRPS